MVYATQTKTFVHQRAWKSSALSTFTPHSDPRKKFPTNMMSCILKPVLKRPCDKVLALKVVLIHEANIKLCRSSNEPSVLAEVCKSAALNSRFFEHLEMHIRLVTTAMKTTLLFPSQVHVARVGSTIKMD